MSAQVGELGVALEANLAPEWLHAAVDVRVLLETAAGGERLATFWTGVAPCTYMGRPDVPLKVAWVREHLVAIFARKSSKLSMDHFVPK